MRWDAVQYDSMHSPRTDAGMELISMAGVRAEDCVLDIGCGTGRLTCELARLADRGVVVGIDPSPEMLNKAKERASSTGNVFLMKIPAQEMGFVNEFDLAYSNSALQWVKEQEDVIARTHRALRPGGGVAFQLPAKDFCWALTDSIYSAINALGLGSKYEKMEPPWRFPLKEEIAGLLRDTGFSKVETFYKDYTFVFGSINDVLGWGVSAALRPYLAPLPPRKQERFKYAFAMGFENYRTGEGIEFGFRRLFALAEK